MARKEYARNTVEFVRIGYHDACIDFTVLFREFSGESKNRFAELKKAIHAAGQYNEFEPAKVVSALDKVSNLIEQVQFGREGSPVLYLRLIASVWSTETETWRKYSAYELEGMEQRVKHAFANTVFDEWDRDKTDGVTIRVWWD